jgi:hypothetical protein
MQAKQAALVGAIFGLILGLIVSRGAGILLLTGLGGALAYLLTEITQET